MSFSLEARRINGFSDKRWPGTRSLRIGNYCHSTKIVPERKKRKTSPSVVNTSFNSLWTLYGMSRTDNVLGRFRHVCPNIVSFHCVVRSSWKFDVKCDAIHEIDLSNFHRRHISLREYRLCERVWICGTSLTINVFCNVNNSLWYARTVLRGEFSLLNLRNDISSRTKTFTSVFGKRRGDRKYAASNKYYRWRFVTIARDRLIIIHVRFARCYSRVRPNMLRWNAGTRRVNNRG